MSPPSIGYGISDGSTNKAAPLFDAHSIACCKFLVFADGGFVGKTLKSRILLYGDSAANINETKHPNINDIVSLKWKNIVVTS